MAEDAEHSAEYIKWSFDTCLYPLRRGSLGECRGIAAGDMKGKNNTTNECFSSLTQELSHGNI